MTNEQIDRAQRRIIARENAKHRRERLVEDVRDAVLSIADVENVVVVVVENECPCMPGVRLPKCVCAGD